MSRIRLGGRTPTWAIGPSPNQVFVALPGDHNGVSGNICDYDSRFVGRESAEHSTQLVGCRHDISPAGVLHDQATDGLLDTFAMPMLPQGVALLFRGQVAPLPGPMDPYVSSAEVFSNIGNDGLKQLLDLAHVPGRYTRNAGDVGSHIY